MWMFIGGFMIGSGLIGLFLSLLFKKDRGKLEKEIQNLKDQKLLLIERCKGVDKIIEVCKENEIMIRHLEAQMKELLEKRTKA